MNSSRNSGDGLLRENTISSTHQMLMITFRNKSPHDDGIFQIYVDTMLLMGKAFSVPPSPIGSCVLKMLKFDRNLSPPAHIRT